jgi:Mg2+ and Co2+ transporter CorA
MQCHEYRIDGMKAEIENEVESLNASLQSHYQFRNTEAVNRVAMLSLILGAGAVLTGFFGMNFGGEFARLIFEPSPQFPVAHYLAIGLVLLLSLGAIGFGIFVVVVNWHDYGAILDPRRKADTAGGSIRRE